MRPISNVRRTPEGALDSSGPGSVLAEVGGDRGAVIVHVPPDWWGREIEIREVSDPWAGIHVAVMARRLPERDDYSAFFASLLKGEYEVRCRKSASSDEDSDPVGIGTVSVVGGAVADLYWQILETRGATATQQLDRTRCRSGGKKGS